MRHHILLAVVLSLAVSLSRESNTETATATPEPTTSTTALEDNTETATASPELTTSTTENNTETVTATPEPTTSTTENNTETVTATPEPTTSTTEDNTETATASPELTTSTTENNTETVTATPEPTTSTTEDNTETATASPEPTTSTTEDNTETATASPEPTTSTTGDVCNPNPCGTDLAECIALHSNYTCRCQYGFYYSENNCRQGKVFPGVITLNASYSDDLQNVNSTQYEEMFQNITKFFEDAFSNLPGFEQTVITQIQSAQEVRASLLTSVTVMNLFTHNSDVDKKEVTSAIEKATINSPVSGYRAANYCDVYNCDKETTVCQEKMIPTCECRADFSKTPWDVLSCSDCSKSCSDERHEYCAKEKGIPQCKCKPNFERKDGVCVQCPVGYSGDNCDNNSELILIIVGTVFGAVILSLVIAVSVVSVRAKHKPDPEKRSLMRPGYSNPNLSDERQNTTFPRVQTTSGHANPGYQPNNPYEYDVSSESGGFRMQSRY
ncbi:PREDICTED: mucin-13 isoform X3 [Calidris pugnax]|uniref:mucin-13 isoform X3 n=1 Tax=Calidris pugnax TaxID=198806 RepID=UPI00071D7295|nr:PREDICTED: mucin-13 isoform X3 [Calidris pugnax]